jgi:hypothetical protein
MPCGTVIDGVLNEELRVWLRPRDGRVAAQVVLDPPAEAPREVVSVEGTPYWTRRTW